MKCRRVQSSELGGEGREIVQGLGILELEETLCAGTTPSFYRFLGAEKKKSG